MPAGRPPKYEPDYPEKAYKLALLGAKNIEIAEFFEVNEDTIYEWKKVYPEFSEALKNGKVKADAEIASSLYERAKGYEYIEQQVVKIKVGRFEESVEVVAVKKVAPPDTTACIFWLKNRHPEAWRDKTEQEITLNMHEIALDELE